MAPPAAPAAPAAPNSAPSSSTRLSLAVAPAIFCLHLRGRDTQTVNTYTTISNVRGSATHRLITPATFGGVPARITPANASNVSPTTPRSMVSSFSSAQTSNDLSIVTATTGMTITDADDTIPGSATSESYTLDDDASRPATPFVTLDINFYPHIVDHIMRNLPLQSWYTLLRQINKKWQTEVDTTLARHMATQSIRSHHSARNRRMESVEHRFPLDWCDKRGKHVMVLDGTRSVMCANADLGRTYLKPQLLRYTLTAVLGRHAVSLKVPTIVVFIAPQTLSSRVPSSTGLLRVSDYPTFPRSHLWDYHFVRADLVPPSIVTIPEIDRSAVERIIFNLHYHKDHAMFGQWEFDFTFVPRDDRFEIYVILTHDPRIHLQLHHGLPPGTPQFEGRILNRLLLSLARPIVRNAGRTRVAFVDADRFLHRWLAPKYFSRADGFGANELGMLNPDTATIEERMRHWLFLFVDHEHIRLWNRPFGRGLDRNVRFITGDEFRKEIPVNDYVFDRVIHPRIPPVEE